MRPPGGTADLGVARLHDLRREHELRSKGWGCRHAATCAGNPSFRQRAGDLGRSRMSQVRPTFQHVRWITAFAVLAAACVFIGQASAAAYGIASGKQCAGPINVGDPYICVAVISNTASDSHAKSLRIRLLQLDALPDPRHAAAQRTAGRTRPGRQRQPRLFHRGSVRNSAVGRRRLGQHHGDSADRRGQPHDLRGRSGDARHIDDQLPSRPDAREQRDHLSQHSRGHHRPLHAGVGDRPVHRRRRRVLPVALHFDLPTTPLDRNSGGYLVARKPCCPLESA